MRNRTLARFAVIGALAGAMALGACGRKGPLDPPPGPGAPRAEAQPEMTGPGGAILPGVLPGQRPAEPPPPPPPNRKLPIDVLLN